MLPHPHQDPLHDQPGRAASRQRGHFGLLRHDQALPVQGRHAPSGALPVHQGDGQHRQRRHNRHLVTDEGHDRQGGYLQGPGHPRPLPNHGQHNAAEH